METTAKYDPSTDEFIINTPSSVAQKYWITNSGTFIIIIKIIYYLLFVINFIFIPAVHAKFAVSICIYSLPLFFLPFSSFFFFL